MSIKRKLDERFLFLTIKNERPADMTIAVKVPILSPKPKLDWLMRSPKTVAISVPRIIVKIRYAT